MTTEPLACPACRTPAVPGGRFCFNCGAPIERAPTDVEAERRVVTVLFGDLTDFTSWAEDLDPERVGVVTDRVLAALSRAVSDLGGHVDKLTGDGIMAVFGAPVAHDDDPGRAVRAAARMQREVHRLVADETGGGQRLGLRVGLNTGEVLAGIQAALSYTVVGDTVNTASRLADAAGVGSVYAGRATVEATDHIASWRPLSPLRLKGKREPVAAFELIGVRSTPVSRRGLGEEAPFVGREAESGRLVGRFMDVVESGRPAAVLVAGEAGIGKTRLVEEFVRFAGELPGARILWGRCTPYGEGRDLAPLADWVRTAAGVSVDEPADDDDVATRVRRLAQRVEAARPDIGLRPAGGLADALLALVGLGDAAAPLVASATPGAPEPDDPVVTGVVTLLSWFSAQAPLVLVLDDLHVAGAALVDTLAEIGGRLTGQALLVGAGRFDVLEQRPDWWQKLPQADVVRIGPLEEAAAERLLRSYLDGGELDESARVAVIERAHGNPFFLAEIVGLLVDRGLLARDGRSWRLAADVTGDVIGEVLPAGVQAVLAARIDSLDPRSKAVLRDAALIGSRVPLTALEALGHPPDEVRRALAELGERGLVGEGPDGNPVFHQALARDVAYAGIPKAERARRHAAVAGWAVDGHGGTLTDVDTFVAAHAERAVLLAGEMGLPPDDAAFAARHAGFVAAARLGEAAAARDEHAAAADLLGRALVLGGDPAYGEDPAVVRRLRVVRAGVLASAFRVDEAARELGDATTAADPALRARALVALGTIRRAQADEAGATDAFERALAAAEEAGDDGVTVEALRALGLLDYLNGRLLLAEQRFREALALAERVEDLRGAGWALQHLTWSATTRGDYATAEESLRRAWSVFSSLADAGGLSWCAGTESFVRVLQGRFRAARSITQQVLPTAEALGERWGYAACLTIDAIAAAELGEISLAADEARRAREGFRVAGDAWGEALALVAAGFAARGAGDLDGATDVLREALDLSRQARHPVVESLAVTTFGYCQLDRGDIAAAEEAARAALDVIAGLDLQQHALVGPRVLLAQVLRARGRLDEALEILREAAETAGEASLLFPRRQALAHFAGILLETGRVDEAARAIGAALDVPAEDVRSRVVALRVQAAVRTAQGRIVDARRALEDALRVALATESRSEAAATERALAELPAEVG